MIHFNAVDDSKQYSTGKIPVLLAFFQHSYALLKAKS